MNALFGKKRDRNKEIHQQNWKHFSPAKLLAKMIFFLTLAISKPEEENQQVPLFVSLFLLPSLTDPL